jgi:hypothetical protein
MEPINTYTFERTGPHGEPLALVVKILPDDDAECYYGEFTPVSKLRGPCAHVDRGIVVLGNPARWERLLEDFRDAVDAAKEEAENADGDTFVGCLISAWLDVRETADSLLEEDYSADAYAELYQHGELVGSRSRDYAWANLDPNGNYKDEDKATAREYCEQDAKRPRALTRYQWSYVGIVAGVYHADEDGGEGEPIAEASCWGFESDDDGLSEEKIASHDVPSEAMHDAFKELENAHTAACADIVTR